MTTRRPTYRIHARRVDAWWALSSPDVDGFYSQVERLDGAEAMARDGIALLLGVQDDSFDLVVEPNGG